MLAMFSGKKLLRQNIIFILNLLTIISLYVKKQLFKVYIVLLNVRYYL